SGKEGETTVIAQGERNIILSYPNVEDKQIKPGEYQLTGKLIWGKYDNPETQPFSVNLTITSNATRK
ncbi:MAG: P pilus assembly protein, chaperone PapD, partial [Nostocales cyanobacterium 94392]|nr:P pilus assembly protein, chaperone PapD [Nostocales cyanobacterium 94392]